MTEIINYGPNAFGIIRKAAKKGVYPPFAYNKDTKHVFGQKIRLGKPIQLGVFARDGLEEKEISFRHSLLLEPRGGRGYLCEARGGLFNTGLFASIMEPICSVLDIAALEDFDEGAALKSFFGNKLPKAPEEEVDYDD